MPDAIMFSGDAFVVLEPNQPEQFLTPDELLEKLKGVLSTMQDSLPRDLEPIKTIEGQAQHLMDTACELDVAPGQFLQWYLVRLEK
jgi:Protein CHLORORESPIRATORY REDUCTION 7